MEGEGGEEHEGEEGEAEEEAEEDDDNVEEEKKKKKKKRRMATTIVRDRYFMTADSLPMLLEYTSTRFFSISAFHSRMISSPNVRTSTARTPSRQ